MRKKIVTLGLISAMTLFAACAGNNKNKIIPTPTIQARPMELAPATATPIAVTKAPTATPVATVTPTAMELPTETVMPSIQPTPTQIITPTVKPTVTVAPTPKPTVTAVPTATPMSTQVITPTVVPVEEITDAYSEGVIITAGYENEWLGIRFTAPKNATVERGSGTWMTAQLSDGTIVQLLAEPVHYENMTAEEASSEWKKELEKSSNTEVNYELNEYYTLTEIAEREYISFFCTTTTAKSEEKQEYCVREQDGYLIYIIFTYEDSNGLTKAKNAFSPY